MREQLQPFRRVQITAQAPRQLRAHPRAIFLIASRSSLPAAPHPSTPAATNGLNSSCRLYAAAASFCGGNDRASFSIAGRFDTDSRLSFNGGMRRIPRDPHDESPMQVDVVIEIPRWSFLKRGARARIDFVSPLPCPFNYGSVRQFIGTDGDFLDAIVLGPRLSRGARVKVFAYGAIGLTDRDMYDDKLVCSSKPLRWWDRQLVLLFMRVYGCAKRMLNRHRRRHGGTVCEGWKSAADAIRRARPCREGTSVQPTVPF